MAFKSILTFFISLPFLFIVEASFSETLTLVADDWCPYNCEPKSHKPGYAVEIATAIFGANGIKVEYRYSSWSDSLRLLQNGEVNGAIGATPQEVKNGIFPIEEIGLSENAFMMRKALGWRYEGVQSLESVRLGAAMDYDYSYELNSYIAKQVEPQVQLLNGNIAAELNITRLYRGDIDVYLGDRNVALYKVSMLGLAEDFKVASSGTPVIPVYIVFSPKILTSRRYADMLSVGIRELRGNGTLSRILKKYGLQDWK